MQCELPNGCSCLDYFFLLRVHRAKDYAAFLPLKLDSKLRDYTSPDTHDNNFRTRITNRNTATPSTEIQTSPNSRRFPPSLPLWYPLSIISCSRFQPWIINCINLIVLFC